MLTIGEIVNYKGVAYSTVANPCVVLKVDPGSAYPFIVQDSNNNTWCFEEKDLEAVPNDEEKDCDCISCKGDGCTKCSVNSLDNYELRVDQALPEDYTGIALQKYTKKKNDALDRMCKENKEPDPVVIKEMTDRILQDFGDPSAEEIETNSKGGKNSKIGVRYDLIPPLAIKELAKVLEQGSKKYDEWNWLNVDVNQHINHALNHIFESLVNKSENNTSETIEQNRIEELSHAFCRLGMALELLLRRRLK